MDLANLKQLPLDHPYGLSVVPIIKSKYSTKSLNGNPSNGNNPLNGNFFNLPNGLLHKTRGFWKLFYSKIP